MIKVSAPGKLFISGEWAILEVGNPGIVAAVNKRVFAEIEEAEKISITIEDFAIKNLEAEFYGKNLNFKRELSEKEKEDIKFIKAAIETVLQYLGNFKNFSIRTWGEETYAELSGEKKKIGFGSSAASVVAVIGAILKFHGEDIESKEAKDRIY